MIREQTSGRCGAGIALRVPRRDRDAIVIAIIVIAAAAVGLDAPLRPAERSDVNWQGKV